MFMIRWVLEQQTIYTNVTLAKIEMLHQKKNQNLHKKNVNCESSNKISSQMET